LSNTVDSRRLKQPRLFSFLNSGMFTEKYGVILKNRKMLLIDGAGVEAYFNGNQLAMRVYYGSNGQKREEV
jgi:hypothetical protein